MAILKRTNAKTGRVTGWQVVVDDRDPLTGERRRRTVGTFRTKAEARERERDAIAAVKRGTAIDPNQVTVGELLDAWLATKRGQVTPQTIADYEITIRRHLKPVFGAIRLQALKAPHVQARYDDWKAAGMSPRLMRGAHLRLSQALDYAVGLELVAGNVARGRELPTLPDPPRATWSPDDAATYLAVSEADWLHPLWHFLLMEGMRRGEALGLRWEDINWERGSAHIVQQVSVDKTAKGAAFIQPRTKTRSGARSVKLTDRTLDALKEHRKAWLARRLAAPSWADHDLIHCTAHGTPINPNNVSRSHEALVIRAGVPRIRVHDLRHTCATLLLRAGTHPKVVSERLGHATVGITLDRYSHVTSDMQDAAAAAMDRLIPRGARASGTDDA